MATTKRMTATAATQGRWTYRHTHQSTKSGSRGCSGRNFGGNCDGDGNSDSDSGDDEDDDGGSGVHNGGVSNGDGVHNGGSCDSDSGGHRLQSLS